MSSFFMCGLPRFEFQTLRDRPPLPQCGGSLSNNAREMEAIDAAPRLKPI